MLCRTRFASELRGRAGSRCTRWALIGGPCGKGGLPAVRLFSESSEGGVDTE
jgi:hypothetical protein